MGLFSSIFTRALGEAGRPLAPPADEHITVEVSDFGDALIDVRIGDMDGSGRMPGVQLELTHEMLSAPAAVAMSAEEAELAARALLIAAAQIRPHERLRVKKRKWHRATRPQEGTDV